MALRLGRSAVAAHRPVARQRTRTHPEAWGKRRRHFVQRSAAIAAAFLRHVFNAPPVASRGTLRIQTLHGPAWKLMHFPPQRENGAAAGKMGTSSRRARKNQRPVKLANCASSSSSVSRKMRTITCGSLPARFFQRMKIPRRRLINI
jgi:hypothetical protein